MTGDGTFHFTEGSLDLEVNSVPYIESRSSFSWLHQRLFTPKSERTLKSRTIKSWLKGSRVHALGFQYFFMVTRWYSRKLFHSLGTVISNDPIRLCQIIALLLDFASLLSQHFSSFFQNSYSPWRPSHFTIFGCFSPDSGLIWSPISRQFSGRWNIQNLLGKVRHISVQRWRNWEKIYRPTCIYKPYLT